MWRSAVSALPLTKGFDRLEKIDAAKSKLKAMKMSTQEVADTVKLVTDAVTGTPYSLDAAFNTATMAIGSGVKDIKRFMTDVTDAAGFAGVDLDRMGVIFTQIQAKGKLTGEEMMQLMEAGLPAKSWIEESYNLTADQFDKMQQKGQITMEMLQTSIEAHAGGMAKNAGETLSGAIDNMQTSIARIGANFLSAIFGGATGDETEGMKDAINKITEKLNQLDAWIKAHREDIKQFFTDAKDAASKVVGVIGEILGTINNLPGGINTVVVAFAAWESIKGIAAVASAISTLNIALGSTAGLAGAAYGPLAAIAAIIAGGVIGGATLSDAVNANGADSEAGKNAINQATAPGMGVPGSSRDPIFQPGSPSSVFGGAGAQRERRGLGPIDPTGGLLGGAVGGRGGGTGKFPQGMPMGAEGWRPAVQQALNQYGPTLGITNRKAWEDALVRQIQTESGGNPFADNPQDSNGKGGKQHVTGLLQFLPETFNSHNISGGGYKDPNAQIAAALDYVVKRYGMDANGAPFQIGRGVGYATGGGISGAGSGTSDSIPAMLSHGEHVLTAKDVQKMGGQGAVYQFRNMLQKFDVGGGVDNFAGPGSEGDMPPDQRSAAIAAQKAQMRWPWLMFQSTERGFNSMESGALDPMEYGSSGALTKISPTKKMDLLRLRSKRTLEYLTNNAMPPGFSGGYQHYADGGAVGLQKLEDMRTAGAIPAAAGSTAKAGESTISKGIDMGAEVINGIIDQAASAAATAASAATTVGTMGAGAAAGPAAGSAAAAAIGMGANAAKRGVKWGADILGIGADSLLQQLTPFGMPRWLSTDPGAFVPQQGITGALGDLMTQGAPGSAVDPNSTEHGIGQGAAPGPSALGPAELAPPPDLFKNDANSFLSTELQQVNAPAPDAQPVYKIDNVYTQDVDSMGRELAKQGRLASMQYTGRPGP